MVVSSISKVRTKHWILFLCALFISVLLYISKIILRNPISSLSGRQQQLYNSSGNNNQIIKEEDYEYSCEVTSRHFVHIKSNIDSNELPQRHYYYQNMNNNTSIEQDPHILILTLVQNHEDYIDHFFNLLDKTDYPNKRISVAFLVSDSTDQSLKRLYTTIHQLQDRWRHKFHEIDVYQKNFLLDFKPDSMDDPLNSRRAYLARAKNFLLTASLREYHDWVAWIDIEMYDYPKTVFNDLMKFNVDVIVPNCLLKRDDDQFWGYDRNNWQESDLSLERQQYSPEHEVLMEDYNQYSMGRHLLVDMPTHSERDHIIPLDGVGGTFTLVKATVHREGAIFPPFIYQHHLDTEGFAKMAKSMGFSVYGMPSYTVYHF
ncbi:MAG: Anp1-domain-containing protein [Benjaminiella poitrasii]|nr:MAG: Anp1-domain-containing protein [Benjaminiella poitrasii]